MKPISVWGMTVFLLLAGSVRVDTCPVPTTMAFLPFVTWTAPPVAQGVGSTYGCRDAWRVATWVYDWSPYPPECGSAERVAMIWGRVQMGAEIDTEWVMGFNEPELTGQAGIDPAEGAELWREIEADYPDRRLVSPSASLGWLTNWYDAYLGLYGEPPRMDAVGHHCYGMFGLEFSLLRCKTAADEVAAWAQAHGVPEVWVTEFGHLPCWPEGAQGSLDFMWEMVSYYETNPTITRWAWFQMAYRGDEVWAFGETCNTSLADYETGELTALGEAYRALVAGYE